MSNYLTHILKAFASNKDFLISEALESDRSATLSAKLLQFMLDLRVNLALVPTTYGGSGFGPSQEFSLIAGAAQLGGVIGWNVFQLCGNVGRVLSFLPPNSVRQLLKTTEDKIVISYQNNPNHGLLETKQSGKYLSGKWPYGSLAKVATHFCAPYLDSDGNENMVVIPRDSVKIWDDWNEDAFQGTATCSYSVEGYEINLKPSLNAQVECANVDFTPWYLVPRAPIKHAAFGIGFSRHILHLGRANSVNGPHSLWDEHENFVNSLEAFIQSVLKQLEALVSGSATAPEIEAASAVIIQLNRDLHGYCLELVLGAMACARSDASRLQLRRSLAEARVMAGHLAVRSDMGDIAYQINEGPRFRRLTSYL